VRAARLAPRPDRVFLDSSGYLAVVNPRDTYHQQAHDAWAALIDQRCQTYTSSFVIAETHALFLTRLGYRHARAFLGQLRTTATRILWVQPAEVEAAETIIDDYSDKNFSLTDATSFVLMERYRIGVALTTDRNFAQYGFQVLGFGS
jgi:predicted nucleic acid-binding protein